MSGYTKGPWEIERDFDMGNIYIRESRGHSGRICRMWTGRTFTDENARIIAAAPDLLEALKFAKEVIEDQAKRSHDGCRCQLCESLPMAIESALSKAGEL